MKDMTGDHIELNLSAYGDFIITFTYQGGDENSAVEHHYTAEQARKLAKKLKRLARELDARA